jgi:hypothetical protein
LADFAHGINGLFGYQRHQRMFFKPSENLLKTSLKPPKTPRKNDFLAIFGVFNSISRLSSRCIHGQSPGKFPVGLSV